MRFTTSKMNRFIMFIFYLSENLKANVRFELSITKFFDTNICTMSIKIWNICVDIKIGHKTEIILDLKKDVIFFRLSSDKDIYLFRRNCGIFIGNNYKISDDASSVISFNHEQHVDMRSSLTFISDTTFETSRQSWNFLYRDLKNIKNLAQHDNSRIKFKRKNQAKTYSKT